MPVGTRRGAATLEGGVALSHKTEHRLTTGSGNRTPWCLPTGANPYVLSKTRTWLFMWLGS